MANEVKLTFQRANKVSNLHLSKLALDMNLLKCMSGFQGGLSKLLANVFEAVIGMKRERERRGEGIEKRGEERRG